MPIEGIGIILHSIIGGVQMKFSQTIPILNDLSYIFEALAQDLPMEAKSELQALMDRIQEDKLIKDADKNELLASLEEGLDMLQTTESGRIRISAISIGRVSRKLWDTVV